MVPAQPSITRGTAAFVPPGDGVVLTIGNFDGVHRGHRALVSRTREVAAALGSPSALLTFDPAPRDVIRPDNGVPRIQVLPDKLATLGATGIDHVVVEPFTLATAGQPPEAFATEILRDRLGVRALVLGYDFRFGRKRAGDAELLRRVLDVPVEEVSALVVDGAPVSSSRIREAVARGDLPTATHLLGRPHALCGTVQHGDARGRALGFPTANVRPDTPLTPPYGVYAVRVEVDGRWVDGVANWGVRPMWELAEPLLEVHLLDFDGDLYDRRLAVSMVQHLRGEARFDGLEALKAAIDADVAAARAALAAT